MTYIGRGALLPDPHAGLRRALGQIGDNTNGTGNVGAAEILASRSRSWASATFVGARHHFSVKLPDGASVEHWRQGLHSHDFQVPGHIVADIILASHAQDAGACLLEVEALTVEDR